jgi:hypothetical protein
MPKTEEEIQKELDTAKQSAIIDANRRKLMYANAESEIIMREKKLEAVKLFCNIVQKYSISNEDMVILLENVPYV